MARTGVPGLREASGEAPAESRPARGRRFRHRNRQLAARTDRAGQLEVGGAWEGNGELRPGGHFDARHELRPVIVVLEDQDVLQPQREADLREA